jgi:hypothetical protein
LSTFDLFQHRTQLLIQYLDKREVGLEEVAGPLEVVVEVVEVVVQQAPAIVSMFHLLLRRR